MVILFLKWRSNILNKYLILANPGHNRIYFDTAMRVSNMELLAISEKAGFKIEEIGEGIEELPHSIVITTKEKLSDDQLKAIGSSSIYYAMFEMLEEGILRPIKCPDFHYFPESMIQILKYNGKTNEQFTRLMVNLALSACGTSSKKITLLDPMCGKGTTLYEGFMRGFDVRGVEINNKWVQEIQTYVTRFLKEGKYKHKAQKSNITAPKGKKLASGFTLTAAADKNDFKKGDVQDFRVYSCDTTQSGSLLGKKSVDIIVSDLPYGVQHGSKNKEDENMDRSPLDLLRRALPEWHLLLKTKGSIVLSFNEFTMKYDDVAAVLEEKEFKVLDYEPFNGYLHRVDQSINRNVIVATK